MGLRALARRLYRFPGPTLNTASDANLGRFAQLLLEALPPGETPAVLNVGGGNRPLPARHVPEAVRQTTHYLDIRKTDISTVIADALHLPLTAGSYSSTFPIPSRRWPRCIACFARAG